MRAIDLLDIQLELMRKWEGESGKKIASLAFARFRKQGMIDEMVMDDEFIESFPYSQAEVLNRAKSYWVTANMCDLLEAAVPRFEAQPIRPQDIPSKYGFVWFDKPVPFSEEPSFNIGDGSMIFAKPRAIQWQYESYGDQLPPIPMLPQDEGYGTLIVTVYLDLEYWITDTVDYTIEDLRAFYGPVIMSWMINISVSEIPTNHLEERTLMALWTLMQQRIALVSGQRGDRASERRIRRYSDMDNEVQVIELRRPVARKAIDDPFAEAPVWSHQWIVDGHWRWQYYPSLDSHRQIWIAPYVKGPEDRPLIIKDKVYKLKR